MTARGSANLSTGVFRKQSVESSTEYKAFQSSYGFKNEASSFSNSHTIVENKKQTSEKQKKGKWKVKKNSNRLLDVPIPAS